MRTVPDGRGGAIDHSRGPQVGSSPGHDEEPGKAPDHMPKLAVGPTHSVCERQQGRLGAQVNISAIHSFLVQAAKHLDPQPTASGTMVPMQGQLFGMLQDLCDRAPSECNVEIMFRPSEEGTAKNDCRTCLEAYMRDPTLEHGRAIAERLQRVTTNRSGLGLLFLARAETADSHFLVISRFPAEQGVVAQEDADRLDVEFMERVFMKNAKAYKSVIYRTASLTAGFDEGRAVDRQLSGPRELSMYWTGDFLASDLRTTGRLGSKRLAEALRAAVNHTTDPVVKRELVSAAQLLRNQDGKTRSARAFLDRLGVTDQGMAAVVRALPRPELMDDVFRFRVAEFDRHIRYRMVELDTGAMLMADDARFDELFESELADNGARLVEQYKSGSAVGEGMVRYSTVGRVIDQRYRKRK